MSTTRHDTSPLVTRREAEPVLGYGPGSLKALMQQRRERWPPAIACRVRDRALLWELAALQAASAIGGTSRSRRPAGADADGLVTCLTCGRRYRSPGPHVARAHQMTAAEYRAEHRLPASVALMAAETRSALAAARQAAIGEDPELVTRMRAAALPNGELCRRSAEARAGTDDLPAVRAARRASGLRALLGPAGAPRGTGGAGEGRRVRVHGGGGCGDAASCRPGRRRPGSASAAPPSAGGATSPDRRRRRGEGVPSPPRLGKRWGACALHEPAAGRPGWWLAPGGGREMASRST